MHYVMHYVMHLRVVEEDGGDRAPHGPPPAVPPVVEHEGCDLAPLAHARAVPHEEATALAVVLVARVPLARVHERLELRE